MIKDYLLTINKLIDRITCITKLQLDFLGILLFSLCVSHTTVVGIYFIIFV